MRNMNLRYECLDAKDDFRAQLKAGHQGGPSWIHAAIGAADDQWDFMIDTAIDTHLPEDAWTEMLLNQLQDKIGRKHLKRARDMLEIRRVMINNGWTKELTSGSAPEPPADVTHRGSNKWKLILQDKKNQLAEERLDKVPTNSRTNRQNRTG
ncbi:hypothetical protein HGRIS_003907 [Hohenbuehelia grisea]|uniref:Transposase n=1 Tax=Hohenbuehelia grisea TaxID=104357 RepID=A0ABR3JHW0_9AGAR